MKKGSLLYGSFCAARVTAFGPWVIMLNSLLGLHKIHLGSSQQDLKAEKEGRVKPSNLVFVFFLISSETVVP